jgi:isoquinoline 1-oxidoreductase subunit beta
MTATSRREFVTILAAAGGGLLLGYRTEGAQRGAATAAATPGTASASFAPNAFIRIPPDGSVTLVMPQAEMGQGVYTSLSMLLAEELEVAPDQIRLEHALPDNKLYANQFFGEQMTGASSSVRAFYEPLRRAGATARAMLVAAAAASWNVDPASCRAHKGVVTHTPTRRTLSYGVLASKAAALPVPDKVTLKDPKDFTLIGTPLKRLDTRSKVNGTAQYGIDVRLPGMMIATVAASPVLGGKVAGIDEQKAKAVPGVRQIVRLEDAVAVVADHMWAAKQGLAALDIRWDDGPNARLSTPDIVAGLAKASETAGVTARKDGDLESALAGAAKKVEAVYESPFLAHVTMEPMNCTVHVRKDSCEVWTGSQVLSRARTTAAEVTGLPLEKVVVHNHFLGGGFGRRLEHDYVTQAVRIATQVDAPVKVVWTREEDVQHDVYRPYYYDRMTAGLDPRGTPVAWTHQIVGPAIIARYLPGAFKDGKDIDAIDGAVQLLYDIPALQIEHVRHEEPVLNTGFWRGVGVTHNNFVVESFIDELAAASKQDPVAFRRALLGKSPRALAVLNLAAKEGRWGKPYPVAAAVALPFSTATGVPTWRK